MQKYFEQLFLEGMHIVVLTVDLRWNHKKILKDISAYKENYLIILISKIISNFTFQFKFITIIELMPRSVEAVYTGY